MSAQNVIATLTEKLAETLRENELLRQKIDKLCRRLFGNSSEKVSPDQLAFAFALLAEAESAPAGGNGVDLPELPVDEPKHRAREADRSQGLPEAPAAQARRHGRRRGAPMRLWR